MLQEVLERLVAAVKQLASLTAPFGASNVLPEAPTGLGTGTPRAMGPQGKDQAKAVMHAVNGLALGATALLVASQRCAAFAFGYLIPSDFTKSLPVRYSPEFAPSEGWPPFPQHLMCPSTRQSTTRHWQTSAGIVWLHLRTAAGVTLLSAAESP